MSKAEEFIGPFFKQERDGPFLYCMIGDEPLMFKREDELIPREQKQLASMRSDILPYSMAFLPISDPEDAVFLDSAFLQKEEFFNWHKRIYAEAGLRFSNCLQFLNQDQIYDEALKLRKIEEKIATICFSHKLNSSTAVDGMLQASIRANSKKMLVQNAGKSDFAIPKSILIEKADLTLPELQKHFDFPSQELVIKADGLGGGFNVRVFSEFKQCLDFANDFDEREVFVLQEKLDPRKFDQCICDFLVKKNEVIKLAHRLKLVADNHWFGNIHTPLLKQSETEYQNLLQCLRSVQGSGYFSEEGYVCGIDYFRSSKERHMSASFITDINARWTGGLPVEVLRKKLNLELEIVHSHFDELDESEIPAYQELMKKHLSGTSFRTFPLSFSPVSKEGKIYVWILIIGRYDHFLETKARYQLENSLPLSNVVADLSRDKRII